MQNDREQRLFVDAGFLSAVSRPRALVILPAETTIPAGMPPCDVFRFSIVEGGGLVCKNGAHAENDGAYTWHEVGISAIAPILVWGLTRHTSLLQALSPKYMSCSPEALATECSNAVAEATDTLLQGVANQNKKLLDEIYALRISLEANKSARFEIENELVKRVPFVPWLDVTTTLSGDSIELGKETLEIEQVIPGRTLGFCGVDLHFHWPRGTTSNLLKAQLHVLDTGQILRSWERQLTGLGGWLQFRLSESLDDLGMALVLRLSIPKPTEIEASSAGSPTRLTLAQQGELAGLDVKINGMASEGKSLAFRTWRAPAGMRLNAFEPKHAIAQPIDNRPAGTIIVPLKWQYKSARKLPPLSGHNDAARLFTFEEDYAQLHPIEEGLSTIRIPAAAAPEVGSIMAEVGNGAANGPFVEFAIGLAEPQLTDADLAVFDPSTLSAFSGWVTAGPTSYSSLMVERPKAYPGTLDLIMATRPVQGNCSFAWARFYNLRASWRGEMAFPIGLNPGISYEPLLALRSEVVTARKSFRVQDRPLVTVACAVNRRQDFPNIARQIIRQTYRQKQILIALNGEELSEDDCRYFKCILPDVRVWYQPPPTTLPVVLNHCLRLANGKYFFKLDADDIYGDNYLVDMVREAENSGADLTGKATFGVAFPDEETIVLNKFGPCHQTVPQVAGGTLCCRTEVASAIGFDEKLVAGSDAKFQEDLRGKGGTIWSGDALNYLHVRYSDVSRHTWQGGPRDYKFWPWYRRYAEEDSWMWFV